MQIKKTNINVTFWDLLVLAIAIIVIIAFMDTFFVPNIFAYIFFCSIFVGIYAIVRLIFAYVYRKTVMQ